MTYVLKKKNIFQHQNKSVLFWYFTSKDIRLSNLNHDEEKSGQICINTKNHGKTTVTSIILQRGEFKFKPTALK